MNEFWTTFVDLSVRVYDTGGLFEVIAGTVVAVSPDGWMLIENAEEDRIAVNLSHCSTIHVDAA
jgi:hypothetical protein